MMKKLLGVIDATTQFADLSELTSHRSLAALPFAGRYRLIDFVLSSMVNSGIQSVAIFPKYQYRSLSFFLPFTDVRCSKFRNWFVHTFWR